MGKELNENSKAGMHIIRRNVKVINTNNSECKLFNLFITSDSKN